MVMVLVFLAVMLAMIAVGQRRLDSVMRVESGFTRAEMRGDRARAMGMIGAALGLGFVIGPFIGGELGAIHERLLSLGHASH